MAPASRRKLFLHIGTRKSGTSALQASVFESVDSLASHGVGVPFSSWGAHYRAIAVPFGDPLPAESDTAAAATQLADRCRATPGDRLLVTFEGLAALDERSVSMIREALSDFDVHLVITVRDLARQLPSEWQQCVKERLLIPFDDYVAKIAARDGDDAELFWRRQGISEVLSRWTDGMDDDHVNVVVVPQSSADRSLLPQLFFGILEIDPATLAVPKFRVNRSLGYAEAETLRRINVALGDRLPDLRSQYRVAVRNLLQRPLRSRRGPAPAIPEAQRPWVESESRREADHLRHAGFRVHGSLDDLIWSGEVDPSHRESVTDAEVAEIAIEILADLAVDHVEKTKDPGNREVREGNGATPAPWSRAVKRIRRSLRRA